MSDKLLKSKPSVGILLLDSDISYIRGDVANKDSFNFEVKFEKVKGYSARRALDKDPKIFYELLNSAKLLENRGVSAIAGNCGYMAYHQKKLAPKLKVPVFLSSLSQIHFISNIISNDSHIGIICADSRYLDKELLNSIDIYDTKNLEIYGLENKKYFYESVIKENIPLNPKEIEKEVVDVAKEIVKDDPKIKVILLECSCLPPYREVVQKETNLPVFDYITMINYVYSSIAST